MINILRKIFGYVKVRVSGYAPERFLNLCNKNGILVWEVMKNQYFYEMKMTISGFKKIRPIVKKTKTKIMIIEKHGLPFFLQKNKKRKMFVVGILVCMILLKLSTLFLWDITIKGTEIYTQEELLNELEKNHIHRGIQLKNISREQIQNIIREAFEHVIWVSSELKGNHLIISVKESKLTDIELYDAQFPDYPTNIEATKSGIIDHIVVRKGIPKKKQGDYVEKGEILVTGEITILDDVGEVCETQYVCSDADITLIYEESYTNEINANYKVKNYKPEEIKGIFLQYKNKLVQFQQKNKKDKKYVTYKMQHQFKLFQKVKLPIYYGMICSREYEWISHKYSKEELLQLQNDKLEGYFAQMQKKGVQIVSNSVKIHVDELHSIASGIVKLKSRAVKTVPLSIERAAQ